MKARDLTGLVFGRLRVMAFNPTRKRHWDCLCECGVIHPARRDHLLSGATKSCGCLNREIVSMLNKTHGAVGTPEYTSWVKMRERCLDPNNNEYHRYGAKGITVCDRWRTSFPNFLSDMGKKPTPKHSIDRINVELGYSPENCRWADQFTQANNKRSNRRVEYRGETKTIAEWERALGVRQGFFQCRLAHGFTVDRAFTQPHRFLGAI